MPTGNTRGWVTNDEDFPMSIPQVFPTACRHPLWDVAELLRVRLAQVSRALDSAILSLLQRQEFMTVRLGALRLGVSLSRRNCQ
jgi:hypothetical protein